jgi:hypothetical protein
MTSSLPPVQPDKSNASQHNVALHPNYDQMIGWLHLILVLSGCVINKCGSFQMWGRLTELLCHSTHFILINCPFIQPYRGNKSAIHVETARLEFLNSWGPGKPTWSTFSSLHQQKAVLRMKTQFKYMIISLFKPELQHQPPPPPSIGCPHSGGILFCHAYQIKENYELHSVHLSFMSNCFCPNFIWILKLGNS